MNRLGTLFVAVALVVLPTACKDKLRKEADKSAERLQDQKADLREESKELANAKQELREDTKDLRVHETDLEKRMNESEVKHDTKDLVDEAKDVSKQAIDVAKAKQSFDVARNERVTQLRLLHGVIASQPMLINVVAAQTRLTDRAAANLAEKLQVFQMRIDETGNLIEALQTVHEDNFKDRNDAAGNAIGNLKDARDAAWNALNDGDRIQSS